MKPITNILLIAAIVCYVFLPFYNVSFEGDWTGFRYITETISNPPFTLKTLFCLVPFVACFGAIALNCMKNRFWGLVVSICVAFGLYFYIVARDFANMANPEFFHITGLGFGFNIGYGLMVAALVSALVSVLPFSFNKLHETLGKKRHEEAPAEVPTAIIPEEEN